MLFRFLIRKFRRHLTLHLLIPLAVGAVVETGIAYYRNLVARPQDLTAYWVSWERLGSLISVYLTYLVVMSYFINKDFQVRFSNLAMLKDTLPTAKSYFAVGTIRLKEWFDPATQVYLATIVGRRFDDLVFRHERVLFFFTASDLRDLRTIHLDGYYAQCLIAIHKHFDIPLAYLERSQIFDVLNDLSVRERKAVGCYPWWIGWLGDRWLNHLPLSSMRRRIRRLAFALVERENGSPCVFRFAKHGDVVTITDVVDAAAVLPYEHIIRSIKERIYRLGSAELLLKRDFTKFFEM